MGLWAWSTGSPGETTMPAQSATRAPAGSRFWPRAAMTPPSTKRSVSRVSRASSSSRVPPRSSSLSMTSVLPWQKLGIALDPLYHLRGGEGKTAPGKLSCFIPPKGVE